MARRPAAAPLLAAAVLCLLGIAARPSCATRVSAMLRSDADAVSQLHREGVSTTRKLLQSDANEELWDAAFEGDLESVKNALEEGADIETRMGEFNETALTVACFEGHVDVVDVLIEAGADVNSVDSEGDTPLVGAVYSGELAIVQALLKAGASTDAVVLGDGRGLQFRVRTDGDDELEQELLIAAGHRVEGLSGVGETPLMLASSFGHASIVHVLLAAGARPDQKDEFDNTALHFASATGGPESENITRALLEAGVDVDVRGYRGRTPLFSAAELGNVEVTEILLAAGADPSLKDDDGETIESLACLCSKAATYDFCVDDGCGNGNTKAVIENLLGKKLQEDDISKKLWKAAEKGDTTVVKEALDAGADIEYKSGELKATPLGVASLEGHTEVVEVLIAAGADVEASDLEGVPPLTAAVFGGEVGVVQALLAAGASTRRLPPGHGLGLLLENEFLESSQGNGSRAHSLAVDAEAGIAGIFGVAETPLILAAALGEERILEALLLGGASPNETDSFNDTALHWVPIWEWPESEDIAKALLREGAPVNARGNHGSTPLHVAAEFGNVAVAKALVEAGADPSLENDQGDTPEDVVCLCARSKVRSFCPKPCMEGEARKDIEQLLSG